jgi:hypothetical protein
MKDEGWVGRDGGWGLEFEDDWEDKLARILGDMAFSFCLRCMLGI